MSVQIRSMIKHDVFIAFLDILGFSSLMSDELKWDKSVGLIFNVINYEIQSLQTKRTSYQDFPNNDLNSLFGSDSVVLWIVPDSSSYEDKCKSLRYLIYAVEQIQYKCALKNIWMRGGISFGPVMYDGNNIAGPGFIKAYKLENSAKFQRVIIDEKQGFQKNSRNCFSVSFVGITLFCSLISIFILSKLITK